MDNPFELPDTRQSYAPAINTTGKSNQFYPAPIDASLNNPNQAPVTIPKEVKSEVGMIDTGSAISQVNQQKSYLDQVTDPNRSAFDANAAKIMAGGTSGTPTGTIQTANVPNATTTPTPTPSTSTGKAYFTNQAGQEAEYTQEQLADPAIQTFLKDNGYVLAKSDGVNVSGDFSTASSQQAAQDAAKAVQELYSDIRNWNIETDPDFIGVANSIKGQYDKLEQEMVKTNYSRQRAYETLGMRSGATQYAGNIQMGIEGEELRQGSERINEIARQESAAISAAKQAYRTSKFQEFNAQVEMLKDTREQKQKELENYSKSIANTINNLKDQQKFDFEVMKYQSELKAKDKPMIVAPGSSIYDTTTGEFIGTAPERPSDNKPLFQKMTNSAGQETIAQYNPTLNAWETVFGGGGDVGISSQALDWATAISNGSAKLSDITGENATALKGQVLSIMQTLPADQSKIEPLKQKITDIDSLLTSKGLNSSVGTGLGRIGLLDVITGEKQNFIAGVQQLVSQDTLDTLINLKAQGGTLGALSDTERVMLQSAATKIGTWAVRDSGGNVTGYNVSQGLFKDELNKIKNLTQKAIEKAGGNTVESASKAVETYYLKNPDKREMIDKLDLYPNPNTGQPYTDDEKAQILGISFNQVGGDTKLASKVASIPDYSNGGQCGRFVNKLTGLGVGDSYASKMAKMDKNITTPAPGMVFTMPYKDTGHTGIILSVKDGIATVKDSNWGLNEKVKTHQIPVYKMTGFRKIS